MGVVDVKIAGSGYFIGGLVGINYESIITASYSSGTVSGNSEVGGLVGGNFYGDYGHVTQCYSTVEVTGTGSFVGGLVGSNWGGTATQCYSTGAVRGTSWHVGGLVGSNNWEGTVTQCYSTGSVNGVWWVGGMVGSNYGEVADCFWDIQTSGWTTSAGGTGKTTAEMQTAGTFLDAGWDFVDEMANGTEDIWWILEGQDYPRLWWVALQVKYSGGSGTADDPYQIATAADLMLLGDSPLDYDKHFILTADIDLDPNLPGRKVFTKAVIAQVTLVSDPSSLSTLGAPFVGVFDGNGHTISHLTIWGGVCVGLFGCLESGAEVRNLGMVNVNITAGGGNVGALVGCNFGKVTKCHSTGPVSGRYCVGGLVGLNYAGSLTACHSTSAVSGEERVGGLVGFNGTQYRYDRPAGSVTQCYSAGCVSGGDWGTGGLAGASDGTVTQCYSTGTVSGGRVVGGLVGCNYTSVNQCYSTGAVSGNEHVGGLVGILGTALACFWDIQTSGQATSVGGTGKTTAEMQTAGTFLNAGWDFVGETAKGSRDIWWINEGQDYPRLWWELVSTRPPRPPAEGNVIELTEASFDQIVLGSDVPVLVDFWAPWCGPCLTMAPVIEEIADEYAGKVKVCKLNVDNAPNITTNYDISFIPTFILFEDGEVQRIWVGVTSKNIITAAIDKLLYPSQPTGLVIELTDATFDNTIYTSDEPVLVFFSAPWCGYCGMMEPIVQEIADEYAGRAKICKLNVDDSPQITSNYGISAIPTLILFKDGTSQKRWVGVTSKNVITDAIDELL